MAIVSIGLGGLDIPQMLEVAVEAERCGASAAWISDHLVLPAGPTSDFPYQGTGLGFDADMPFPDVWAMLGHLAATTSTLRLGVGVYVAPLRHPFTLARGAATAQLLSRGRLLVGVGAGWLSEEFDAVGVPFGDRGALLDATVDICRDLWSNGRAQRSEGPYQFSTVQLRPAPDTAPPLFAGGGSLPALRRAARLDGWYAPAVTVAEAVQARDVIEEERARLGRPDAFEYVVRPAAPVTPETVRQFHLEGFEHLSVPLVSMLDERRPATVGMEVARVVETLRG